MDWICVDTMPEHCGMPLLLCGINGFNQVEVFIGFTGYFRGGRLLFHSNTKDVNIDDWDITHWMPLPQPPKEGLNGTEIN